MLPSIQSFCSDDSVLETIITSSTHRQDHADDPVLEKIFAYLREENSKEKARKPLPTTVSDMSFFIPKFCVGFINYCNWIDEFDIGESISQIFASSINDQVSITFRLFQTSAFCSLFCIRRTENSDCSSASRKRWHVWSGVLRRRTTMERKGPQMT